MRIRKNIDSLKKNFYWRKKEFNGFTSITEEKLQEILKDVEHFAQINPKEYIHPEFYFYADVLMYLTSSLGIKKYTFDERIVFLIEAVDKELKALQISNLIEAELTLETNERNDALKQKELIAQETDKKTKEELDFYDRQLRIYEKMYSAKIRNRKKFEEAPGKDYTNMLLDNTTSMTFKNISEEQLVEISKKAQEWIIQTDSEGNQKRASFNIIYQNTILNLTSKQEQIIFFILVVDPNLNAYKIYMENGSWEQIKREMIETLGFYSKDLIHLEEKYHQRFTPQKQISVFQLIKGE